MRITNITVCKSNLRFTLDTPFTGASILQEWDPVIHGKDRMVAEETLQFMNGEAVAARFAGSHERAYGRFRILVADKVLEGVCYVTDFEADVHQNDHPYPQPENIKTLDGTREINAMCGINQVRPNVVLPSTLSLSEKPDTIPFEFEGKTYWIYQEALAQIEEQVQGYDLCTFILLNMNIRWITDSSQDILNVCVHPNYEWGNTDAYISAFNMTTTEGWQSYAAWVAFLAQRYTRDDKKYGALGGMVIGNEVNMQSYWGNMGNAPVDYYMEEYTQAMRIAWIAGKLAYSNFRVYVSLTNSWDDENKNDLRCYHARWVIDWLAKLGERDGDFGWHVAHHPYPEDLRYPDFWNDRHADFNFSTPFITFKNMEVLEAYLAQPQLLYRGQPRRIIFSEQGFNSQSGPLQKTTERQAAAAYVLAYMKARNMKTVDMFTHHSFRDNLGEFGLNLGVFRYDKTAPDHLGEPKPIFQSILAMETPAEGAAIAFAREVIGDAMFDYLLHPEVLCGERDASVDVEFG